MLISCLHASHEIFISFSWKNVHLIENHFFSGKKNNWASMNCITNSLVRRYWQKQLTQQKNLRLMGDKRCCKLLCWIKGNKFSCYFSEYKSTICLFSGGIVSSHEKNFFEISSPISYLDERSWIKILAMSKSLQNFEKSSREIYEKTYGGNYVNQTKS